MTYERAAAFFCVLFIFVLSGFISWAGDVTDNDVVRFLGILGLLITWIAAHKEQKSILQYIAELERELAELDDDEESDQQ